MTVYTPSTEERDLKKIIMAVQQLASGRSNAVGTVTLTAAAATTTVTTDNCSVGSVPVLVPTTAHAAAEQGNGTLYISVVANKSFTISHSNNAQTDRTYLYAIQG